MSKKYTQRPYQVDCIGAAFDALINGVSSMVLTLPTGTGKTVLIADMIMKFVQEYGYDVLFLANRRELIRQNYCKVQEYTGLAEYLEIDVEMGDSKFNPSAKVIIGSQQTCCRVNRLIGFIPKVIIIDECHGAQSASYRAILSRFPGSIVVGITATAQRGDNKALFAKDLDGNEVKVKDAVTGKERPIAEGEYVFQQHIYDYPILRAIEEGWLVNIRACPVKSGVDISSVHVRTNTEGERDFAAKELNAVLEKDEKVIVGRINRAIAAWKKVARDRPTVVFCPSVKYAHWAADLWRQAGFTAQSIDASTPLAERDDAINKIKSGKCQVTCNFGIYTHGTDVPKWSCVVMLRPINSWGLYCQCIGRGTRPSESIAHWLSGMARAEDRINLIAGSDKRDCIIIDVVDVCKKHDICAAPSILGLPADLDMQNATLTEAHALMEEFKTVRHKVLGACPATYEELAVKLKEASLLLGSKADSVGSWGVAEDGSYRYTKCPVGYTAHLSRQDYADGTEGWRLKVWDAKLKLPVYDQTKPRRKESLRSYFDSASRAVNRLVKVWAEEHKKPTSSMLTPKQLWVLKEKGRYSIEDIDAMQFGYAKIRVGQIARRY